MGVAFLGVLWQLTLSDMIYKTFGVGRVMQPLSDFDYSCRRLEHPLLEACAGTSERLNWNPA